MNNRQCVTSLIGFSNTLSQMIVAMKIDPEMTGTVCETLDKMFKVDDEELVLKAINCELVPFLLKLLDAGQSAHTSSTKALIVEVLKAMKESQTYGEQINAMLEKSDVWAEFRDQKHDLFINNTPIAGYLTGGANVAGYLTQGSAGSQQMSPPPIDEY
jgi:DnaJ family protein C protein 13